MAALTLSQMLDAALGSPHLVNFGELHSFLQAVLRHLGLQDLPAQEQGHSPTPLLEGHPGEEGGQSRGLGTGLEPVVPAKDTLQGTMSTPQVTSVAIKMGQMKEKMEANNSGISKALLEEINRIKAAQACMEEDIQRIQEALGLKRLEERLRLCPALEEEDSEGQTAPAEPPKSDKDTQCRASLALGPKGPPEKWAAAPSVRTRTSDGSASTPGTQPGSHSTQTPTLGAQTGSSCTQTPTLGIQPRSPSIQTTMQGVQAVLPGTQEEGAEVQPSCNMEMVAAFCQIRQLSHLYATLKEQVAQLAITKSDRTELQKFHLLFPEGDQENITSVLADLWGQMSSLQGLASDLQGEKGKIRQLEDALGKLQVSEADWTADGSHKTTLQLGLVLQELKQEMGEQQQKNQAVLEQLVAKSADQLQAQLDQLRVMVKSPWQEEAQTARLICSRDTSVQVEQLLQRYEKLQEQVESFVCQQAVGKVARQLLERNQQDEKLLKHIQVTIVQLQGENERLSSIVENLQDGFQEKQKDIEALFQSLEKLEKEKADKEDLAVDAKATKSTLGSKVSRGQFEASMERLMEMMEKMQSQGVAQEQGLQQVQQQLREVMDHKLDRLELGPVQQQLEHCQNILKRLKDKVSQTEADDAAGIKYPLAHCHCLSCDHPLNTPAPGPKNMALPLLPLMLPCPARGTPTVFKPQETQQHNNRKQATEHSFPSVPRSSGGQHTITYLLQSCQLLQPKPPNTPWPRQDKETARLGWDGHIYQGQQKRQQPGLVEKGSATSTEDRQESSDGHRS
ncbi:glutamine-rich protein 2-like isoform X2 [Cuculus canorus]|uniref:glutamine-rich protein 2-like isoform X2 n=1 Tax=Cuculus canorus TaxID=55661 RepID=UPI0023AA8E2B|nr:glutamine-rich protein 2-like isoform X2 [Cuculus canorus]